jgi:hypothetical protein
MPNDIFSDEPEETALAGIPENAITLPGTGNYAQLQKVAEFLSRSTIIPATYQRKPENCFVALELAQRVGASPMLVMQNMFVIQGRPSWSSQFVTAIANNCGRFTPIRYKWSGTPGQDNWGCTAYMTEIASNEVLEGSEVTLGLSKAEGWYDKKGSKWQTMPKQMLMYRAAAWLVRAYAPELLAGTHTVEESQDMINVTPIREETAAERAWREQHENAVL